MMRTRTSPSQINQKLNELAKSIGYKVISPCNSLRNNITIECASGHVYETQGENFRAGYRCPKCSGVDKQTAAEKLTILLNELSYKQLSPYVNAKTKIQFLCDFGHEFSMVPNNLKSGQRCNKCKKCGSYDVNKPGTLYVVRWAYNQHTFIKYGITNKNLKTRLSGQKRGTKYIPTVINQLHFQDGHIPKTIENDIKALKLCKGVSKEMFSDGYTETCIDNTYSIDLINNILRTYDSYTKNSKT